MLTSSLYGKYLILSKIVQLVLLILFLPCACSGQKATKPTLYRLELTPHVISGMQCPVKKHRGKWEKNSL